MSALAGTLAGTGRPLDFLSGTPRARAIDRWIHVFTAALLVALVLVGFVPDSVAKVAEIQAGTRAPFPWVLHLHAVLMGSFLALLLGQTTLVALGRRDLHAWLGRAAFVIAPALVIVGFILVPTMYHQVSDALATAAPAHANNFSSSFCARTTSCSCSCGWACCFRCSSRWACGRARRTPASTSG